MVLDLSISHWEIILPTRIQCLCKFPFAFSLVASLHFQSHFVVQSLSCIWLFVTPWTAACQGFLSFTISWSLLRLMSNESMMPSNHLILCCPLLLPSIFLSISPSNEHPQLVSFRMDWLDLLAVKGTHKSLLQHHSSKASILRCSAFFIVQLSHPYMTTGKTIVLTRWTTCF